jgi:hypothetical protein
MFEGAYLYRGYECSSGEAVEVAGVEGRVKINVKLPTAGKGHHE